MSAYRNYTHNVSAVSKNLEKLSSGYRINRAGDDAAGLAISEKMRIQITGLEQAQSNAKSGINLVQTAEGAMTEIHDMLNRMYTLAEQSANGTYSDDVDREQLQKEVVSLRTEINRIADATNYNGINLLDGSQAKPDGVTIEALTDDTVAAVKTEALGTFADATDVNGKLTSGTAATKYQAKFYIDDITNTDANQKKLTVTYKDASGADKTVTLTIAKDKELSAANVAAALNAGATQGDVTWADTGTAASKNTTSGAVENGQFKELYKASVDGNVLTIEALYSGGDAVTGDKGKVLDAKATTFGVTLTNDFVDADKAKVEEKLKEKYAGNAGTAQNIAYGSAAGEPTKNVNKTEANYQVASRKLTLANDLTGEKAHNRAIKVGDKTYVIKNKDSDKALDVDDLAAADKVEVEVAGTATAAEIAEALAATITREEGTNGNYVADADGTVLTISESTNRGQDVLDGNEEEGKFKDVASDVQFTTTDAAGGRKGSITFNASALKDGTVLNVGDKTLVLSRNASQEVTKDQTLVTFNKNATSEQIASAVASALEDAGIEGATADGTKVVFSHAEIEGGLSATGRGLELQIGDTADSFNKMNVSIKDMHAAAMTFATTDLGADPTDLQKSVAAKGLSIASIDISSQEGASDAMAVIKNAVNYVSDVRGDLGALQNRLDHTINNLSVTQENIQDAESTIRDVDIAKEMMAYTKNNILVQSAQAMLAQANQLPQGVLQLLG